MSSSSFEEMEPRARRRLDVFELLILDDVGYVQQAPEEVEVFFTLMAERYERRSMLITSDLVFSEWEKIFKNPMTTTAAIDRLVHQSEILEFDVTSFRSEDAKNRSGTGRTHRATDTRAFHLRAAERVLEIIVLERARHPLDLGATDALSGSGGAPSSDCRSDLLGNGASFGELRDSKRRLA